ncbi:hypothetical protein AVEN_235873-1 [Araneus ventricosus]|uniref:Uncharacterized protein n=1 Tax=Araneus ventricosus TaxID=182803 RepID=A0A4Y2T0Y7_ARAVE|nr:hypothetical protein AVEN_235873-1 [Araneus ventricosus]
MALKYWKKNERLFKQYLDIEEDEKHSNKYDEEMLELLEQRDEIELNHMRKILDSVDRKSSEYCIHHHAVFRPESTSTPLRLVFDASANSSNGVSLNSILLNGGTVQQELVSIISRFRTSTRALKALAEEEQSEFPQAAETLLTDVYVDDILSGSNNLEETKALQHQLIQLLKKGGMELHKWVSNHPELLYDNKNLDYYFHQTPTV